MPAGRWNDDPVVCGWRMAWRSRFPLASVDQYQCDFCHAGRHFIGPHCTAARAHARKIGYVIVLYFVPQQAARGDRAAKYKAATAHKMGVYGRRHTRSKSKQCAHGKMCKCVGGPGSLAGRSRGKTRPRRLRPRRPAGRTGPLQGRWAPATDHTGRGRRGRPAACSKTDPPGPRALAARPASPRSSHVPTPVSISAPAQDRSIPSRRRPSPRKRPDRQPAQRKRSGHPARLCPQPLPARARDVAGRAARPPVQTDILYICPSAP